MNPSHRGRQPLSLADNLNRGFVISLEPLRTDINEEPTVVSVAEQNYAVSQDWHVGLHEVPSLVSRTQSVQATVLLEMHHD